MMKRILTILAALAFAVCASAQWQPQSRIVTDTLKSKVLGTDRAYNVFLPKSYDTDKDRQYPVLYLLHGMLDTNMGWTMRGHVKDVMDQLTASGEACEMIIVTPNAGGNIYKGDWNGYFNMPGWNYEDFFFTEFVPFIEKTYRVIGDKEHRAVAGLSMGGGGAASYAQRHPEMFCAAYAMSALMDIPEFPAQQGQPSQEMPEQVTLLNEAVKELSCVRFVNDADEPARQRLRTIRWFVDCGDDDFLFDRNVEFVQAMHKAFVPVEFRVRDGGHTWEYWHSALYTCLPFVSRCYGK